MKNEKNINENLIKNIKYLMEYYKTDITNLAIQLNVDDSTIRKYLKGDRTIDEKTISKIAKHFDIDSTLLTKYDVEKYIASLYKPNKSNPLPTIDEPPFDFSKASQKAKTGKYFNDLFYKKCETKLLQKSQRFFKASYEETHSDEDLIWVVYLELFVSFFNSRNYELFEDGTYKLKPIDLIEPEEVDFESLEELYEHYKYLRSKKKWRDLIDFYTALRYLIGLPILIECDREQETFSGFVMMNELRLLGNKYAIKTLSESMDYFSKTFLK